MNKSLYDKLSKVCKKESPADLIFRDAHIFDAYTASFYDGDVAVKQGYIAGIGKDFPGDTVIDCKGKYLFPGFIDAHAHLEAALVPPNELISAAAACGTTSFIVTPHEVWTVAGKEGIDYLLKQSEKSPANVFLMLPYCISPSLSEGHETKFSSTDFFSFLKNPRILGLEELMDTRGVIHSNPVLWKTADGTESKFPGGYSSFLSLNSEDCSLLKLQTGQVPKDFSYTLDEVHAGMHIHIKEDSAVHKLETSIQGILSKGIDSRSFSFCTDGKKVGDILREGHINHLIRRAISLGLPVGKAYQMASINAAECYHLSHLGVIAPGKQADLVLLSDPKKVDIEAVFHKGKRVEKKEKYPISHCPKELKKTLHFSPLEEEDFHLPIFKQNSTVIGIQEGEIRNSRLQVNFRRSNNFDPLENPDYRKIASISRNSGGKRMCVAIFSGYPIRQGAIATSLSRDCDGILVIGDSDRDMCLAANELLRTQGGVSVVSQGTVLFSLALPIMGLLTDCGHEKVEEQLRLLKEKLHEMGIGTAMDPLLPLAFLSSPSIPEIRITPRGMYVIKGAQSRLLKQ